jgi:lipopolysaccharide export system permease protein
VLFDFFPSRTLTWYLAKTFIVRILAVLVMLVLVLMMLDLLSKSGDILAVPGNGEAELLRYVSLRIPQLIARFMPYSVLLATILTLATFNQNSEVIAMKAAGLSAHQILAPLVLVALAVAALQFAFNERMVTRANAALNAWDAVDFGPVPTDPGVRANIFLNDGNDVLLASHIAGSGAQTVLRGVTFYERDDAGMIVRQLRAPMARYAAPGWRLENARAFEVGPAEARDLAAPVVVAPGITLDQIMLERVDPDSEAIGELARSIEALDAAGRRTGELKGKWWHKISGPLSTVLMPLLGAVAGFGLARSGHLLARAIIGMALGFAFFVVDNAALAMGGFGGYPPLLAAWAPFVLFFLVGETVLIRTEE